jgi:hypothetical protein
MDNFFKMDEKNMLEYTSKKSIEVEKEMLSLKFNPRVETSKDKSGNKTKATMTKTFDDKKYQESTNMESLQRIVKKIFNEIIDMKNNCGEGSSNPKKIFIFPPKKSTPPTTKISSHVEGINIEDFLQVLKYWENDTRTESKEEEEGEQEQ